jgi:uncharacterized repeat protein (TIGR03943 family)
MDRDRRPGGRAAAALRAGVVLALAALLAVRYLDGSLGYYVNLRYGWLTVVAVACLVALAAVLMAAAVRGGHASGHHERLSWLGIGLLALPVVLGLIPPRPLGTAAMATRALQIGAIPAAAGRAVTADATIADPGGARTVLDWLVLFHQADGTGGDASRFAGETARVRGFVYRDERFPAGTFMVSRFLLSCCVADAVPIGLAVRWPDADFLDDDAWVWVTGEFSVEIFLDERVPMLVATEVVAAEQPAQPYLYY